MGRGGNRCRVRWHEICSIVSVAAEPLQRIVRVRRDYNRWVASETLEDYALRYTAQRFRRWSPATVANTALGTASFLVLEAVGASLLVEHGFVNAAWAIVAAGLLILLLGLPISITAARYGVDMDLLTRGAGFGYIGSTVTSLIYASFTFIFFALEAAVMAYALELALGIPPVWGYVVCALVVIPLVIHGITAISRFQIWTQPVWVALMVLPFAAVLWQDPHAFGALVHYPGAHGASGGFDGLRFGAALTVGLALVTQMGEQADYLRFMPAPAPGRRARWWAAVAAGGVGWVPIGVLKMLAGAALAWLAMQHGVASERAVDPNQMYLTANLYWLPHGAAVVVTALFVVVSQLKINVTNAYAGSLAWSNFFSRWTHSHPGRVVWVVFNIGIALLLMEMNVFDAMAAVLGVYANVAIAWIGAVVADLVINKPLGWSPRGIEFQRGHLYDVNPVGLGAMAAAAGLGIAAHLGMLGPTPQAFSALVALVTALLTAPALAWATRGRYYLARPRARPMAAAHGGVEVQRCVVCGGDYEGPDTTHCPAYGGVICSLCCTLDARCDDLCKPHARLSAQWQRGLQRVLPQRWTPYLEGGLAAFGLWMAVLTPLAAAAVALVFHYVGAWPSASATGGRWQTLWAAGYLPVLAWTWLLLAGLAWWAVLAQKSRRVALEESRRQTAALLREIEAHRRTDRQLQEARQQAERARRQADHANAAKTRYLGSLSHELRTPLNAILGYAQMLQEAADLPPARRAAADVVRRAGEHVLALVEGTLDIARIESGRLQLQPQPTELRALVEEMVALMAPQAAARGLAFQLRPPSVWPGWVRADGARLRQVLLNVLGNAVKFTDQGGVTLRVGYAWGVATFEVADTGPGIAADERERIFEPFVRGRAAQAGVAGSGLGLTVARLLTDLMGGELTIDDTAGGGTTVRLRLHLPAMAAAGTPWQPPERVGYHGLRRQVMVVDNEAADRDLLVHWLQPLGFEVRAYASGEAALQAIHDGARPDVVLLDPAMPGLDGWQTLAALRALPLHPAPAVAIVSANAFERGVEHPGGVPPQDFLVKPLTRAALLDWMGQALGLRWRTREPVAPSVPERVQVEAVAEVKDEAARSGGEAVVALPTGLCASLLQAARRGHRRGVEAALDVAQALPDLSPATAALLRQWRADAQTFRFDRLLAQLPSLLAPTALVMPHPTVAVEPSAGEGAAAHGVGPCGTGPNGPCPNALPSENTFPASEPHGDDERP